MAVVEVPGIGNVHFADGISPEEMSKGVQGLLAQQKANSGQLPANGTIPGASSTEQPAAQAGSPAQLAVAGAPKQAPITSGQQLREDNNPLTTGLSSMATEGAQGASQAVGGDSIFQKIMGLARIANAPAVGAGGAVGTTIQNVLANIPGLGGAGGVIPAGGAAIGDAVTQLASGGPIMKSAINTGKALSQVAPRILAPGHLRAAGGEAIAQQLGSHATTLERVFTRPASKAAYELAEASGPVKTNVMRDIVEQAFYSHDFMSNPSNPALKYLSNLEKKFTDYKQLPYGDVIKEVQALKSKADAALSGATPNNILGKTLLEARELLISELDNTSSVYRSANRLYRQEQATIDIMNAVRQGTPGVNLEKLIENSPDVAKAFSPKVVKEITHIAKELNDVASSTPAGGFRQTLSALAKPITNMMTTSWGRAALRSSLSTTGDRTPRAIASAVQTYKALTPREQAQE